MPDHAMFQQLLGQAQSRSAIGMHLHIPSFTSLLACHAMQALYESVRRHVGNHLLLEDSPVILSTLPRVADKMQPFYICDSTHLVQPQSAHHHCVQAAPNLLRSGPVQGLASVACKYSALPPPGAGWSVSAG